MKKIIVTAVILFAANVILAQGVQVSVYGGYVFDDSFDSYYDNSRFYEGKIKGGLQWGTGVEFPINSVIGIEALYLRQDTNSPTTFSDGVFNVQFVDFDLAINYLMLGGIHHFRKPDKPFEFFTGGMLGVMFGSLENPENGNSESATKFSWGIKGGGIYWASEKVGIKIQAQLLSVVQGAGGGFYFGTSGGGVGLSTYSSIYQFSLGGGLVFALN